MSGMAGKVRRCNESDEFDLSNYDQAKCDDLCKNAFSSPLPLENMIRISFVVGGGKLVRQRYSDDLPKLLMGALSAVGYVNDESAAVANESVGKYKYQHDTNKNLKFVHVFPQIGGADKGHGDADEEEEEEAEDGPSTPEEALMVFEGQDFERLVGNHLKTYSQMKKLLEMLKTRVAKLEEIEAKMIAMKQLDAEEQTMFDSIGAEALKTKIKFVTVKLQGMLDEGQLTSSEKDVFLEQLEGKLEQLGHERQKSEIEGKAKKVEALDKQKEAMLKTKAAVKDASAVSLPPLRYAAEVRKLYVKLNDINKTEKEKKGHYTIDELKKIGEKQEVEEAIVELKTRSRMWLEDDATFKERVDACKRSAASAKKPSGGGSGAGRPAGSGGYSSGGFQSVSGGARPAKAKGAGPATRNAFGALG